MAALTISLATLPSFPIAREHGAGDVHRAYSSYLGTGWYSIGDGNGLFMPIFRHLFNE